jgi:hypothetical protein
LSYTNKIPRVTHLAALGEGTVVHYFLFSGYMSLTRTEDVSPRMAENMFKNLH